MFDNIHNVDVQLMLDLSREKRDSSLKLKERLENVDMQLLFNLCEEHELDGVVASHIIHDGLCNLPSYWMNSYSKRKEQLSFFKEKTINICFEMYNNGIKMLVLKNGGIMCDMVSDEAACPMEDIDSLVKKDDFLKAHEILIHNGFKFKFRSDYEKEDLINAFRDGSTEYYIESPYGNEMWFELSWRAVSGRWIRQDLEPSADDLVKKSYFAPGTKVGILSPEDNLLQVCVHTAKHSYVRAPGLRLHLDVERIVAHKRINWQLFVKKVCDAHVKTSSYFSLYFAKFLFGTEIPEWVFVALTPSKKKKRRILLMLSNAGLLYPKKRKFSKIQFLKFQTSLYDSLLDMWYVFYPKNKRLHDMYNYSQSWKTPYYLVIHGLDLIGIRKKK